MKTTTKDADVVLATAAGGAFHLATTKLKVHKRRGLDVPMTAEESRRYWLNEGKPLPRRLCRVWVIRMGIVNGCAMGGCDVTHARSEKEARIEWSRFLEKRGLVADGPGLAKATADAADLAVAS